MEMKSMYWEKIFANDATDKDLPSKYTNSSYNLMTKNPKQPYQKLGGRPKFSFLQRWHTAGQLAYEKMFNITNYQIMQIKTTMRYHTSQNGHH